VGMSIDVEDVRRKITPRTKAIIPVHLYGHAADMTSINALAAEHGIAVVEDAAEAHGARADGRVVGSIGTCATFSFFGNKIITTGEGGAVTTNDAQLAKRLRLLRGQGMDPERRYWFPVVGYNYRMTNIAAAIGLAQLEGVDRKLSTRKAIAANYDARLAGNPLVRTPQSQPWSNSVNWLYTVLLELPTVEDRDEVGRRLADDGIETRPIFYPMHQMPPYYEADGHYPVADSIARRGLTLPTHVQLTDSQIDRICERLTVHVAAVAARA